MKYCLIFLFATLVAGISAHPLLRLNPLMAFGDGDLEDYWKYQFLANQFQQAQASQPNVRSSAPAAPVGRQQAAAPVGRQQAAAPGAAQASNPFTDFQPMMTFDGDIEFRNQYGMEWDDLYS